jgi:PAS domain-containing protein
MVEQARQWASDTRSGGQYDIRFRTIAADTGQLRWIRCQGRAYFSPLGEVYRFVGIAQDVTQEQPTRQQLAASDGLNKLTTALSGTGVYRVDLLTDELVHSSTFAYRVCGNANAKLSRIEFLLALHPQDELLRQAALEQATRTGVLVYEPRFIWPDGTIYHTRIVGVMHRDETGKPLFIVGLVEELTQYTISPASLSTTELGFKTLISASPVAMGVFQGQNLVVETANEAMYSLLECDREIIGKPLLAALPTLRDQSFAVLLQRAYTSSEMVTSSHQLVSFWQQGQLINRHYTFFFTPLWDSYRNLYAILATALDVSDQFIAQKRLEVSDARFRTIIEQAPMAIGLLKGRAMLVEVGNAKLFEAWGKTKAVLGLPIREALPEIEEQGFLELMDNVFNTGKPYFGHSMSVQLVRKKKPEVVYFDFVYTPLRDTSGAITGIMLMATELPQPIST